MHTMKWAKSKLSILSNFFYKLSALMATQVLLA
jgi:hypothetical protein